MAFTWRKGLIYFLLLFIVVVGSFIYFQWKQLQCSTIDTVNASISVQTGSLLYVGLNADTDSLKFGKVSPGSMARRSIRAQYTQDALVKVLVDGNFASWFGITPVEFYLPATQRKEITFDVNVPENAVAGNYTATVYFCFRDVGDSD